jgi:formylglycine-generating enzyme required for sulfatase activity
MMPGKDPVGNLAQALEHGLIAEAEKRDSLGLQNRLDADERALARRLRDFSRDKTAFLLVVDQFEELFTFADDAPRKRFETLLAHALQDPDCPLFLISTVRADFLDRFESLPRLQAIYNSHCKRYFLPTISEHGLREVIEQPARLAGLDVSEVTTAILDDARDEIGALPLVENALLTLWQHRDPKGNRLSGDRYRRENGIAGMLSTQADALLGRIDRAVPKGRQAALELLLRLTRVNDEGRHTRQRIIREEAVMVAGDGDDAQGERVVRLLSGERAPDAHHHGSLRLITLSTERQGESDGQYVDLIHETLIRPRSRDERTGKRIGYWPTLYDYIEQNRDRDLHRQQLKFQTERWLASKGVGRWWNLAGWRDLRRYRPLRVREESPEGRFLSWSRRMVWVSLAPLVLLAGIVGVLGESARWADRNGFPPIYIVFKPLWTLGWHPLPKMVEVPSGSFVTGCVEGRNDVEGEGGCDDGETPAHEVTITHPFRMGKHEVTFLEYDYSVWDRKRHGDSRVSYPNDSGWGRYARPAINVSWEDAKAYVQWLREKTGGTYRLPREAEWEYAARAGSDTAYWWGKDFDEDKALCGADGQERNTVPIGSFPANPFGLNDTSGNVWEWVEDAYAPYSKGAVTIDPRTDPAELTPKENAGVSRVLRGGSWDARPWVCRAALRNGTPPDYRLNNVGFRVYCSAPIE